ncbi:MAG: hypothetical protein H7832_11485 [Magnetococcus sp. DMHC-6]
MIEKKAPIGRKQAVPSNKKELLKIPDKPTFAIGEAAQHFALRVGLKPETARTRLYRAIANGEIEATRHLGSLRIPRHELVRIVKGEPVYHE